jgi:hypothetical protein
VQIVFIIPAQTWTKLLSKSDISPQADRHFRLEVVTLTTQAKTPSVTAADRLVQVWFGTHVVCEYRADLATASQYADAMRRRFAGLRVTIEPNPDRLTEDAVAPLPGERLWELTP